MARLEWELTLFGRRLRFDLCMAELDTDAHRAAVARLEAKRAEDAEAAKVAATAAAEALALERKKVAHLEAEYSRMHTQAQIFEAQRDVAVCDRQSAIDELLRLTLVLEKHELDAARAD